MPLASSSHKGLWYASKWENVRSVFEPQNQADGTRFWAFHPAFPMDVRSLSFGRHRNIRLPSDDYLGMLYVSAGSAQYQFQDRHFQVQERDLIVINGAFYHRLSKVITAPFQAIVLYFHPDLIRATDATGDDVQYLSPFLLQDATFPHIISHRTGLPAEVYNFIAKIQCGLPASTDRARLAARTYLKMILLLLLNHCEGQLGTAKVCDWRQRSLARLRPLFDHLETHYSEPLPLARMSAFVGMSKSHFTRFFKELVGQSFGTYLNHFRVAKAKALLTSTDKPMSEISQDIGFCDQSYFGLIFRRLVRMTPREYRRSFGPPR
jgi:AraC-like DNA-binding protein